MATGPDTAEFSDRAAQRWRNQVDEVICTALRDELVELLRTIAPRLDAATEQMRRLGLAKAAADAALKALASTVEGAARDGLRPSAEAARSGS